MDIWSQPSLCLRSARSLEDAAKTKTKMEHGARGIMDGRGERWRIATITSVVKRDEARVCGWRLVLAWKWGRNGWLAAAKLHILPPGAEVSARVTLSCKTDVVAYRVWIWNVPHFGACNMKGIYRRRLARLPGSTRDFRRLTCRLPSHCIGNYSTPVDLCLT